MPPTHDFPASPLGWVNLLVAMPSEARPVIDHRGLSEVRGTAPFSLYRGDGLRLIVSGTGKEAAAAAAGYLFRASDSERDQGWLNLGIGGHPTLPLGSIAMAHKVVDEAGGRCWYPPRVHEVPCPPVEVHTVSRVEHHFRAPVLYEMEAAGFLAACTRFATAEQAQVVKIVSDNDASPSVDITRERIGEWIAAQLPVIDTVIASLHGVAADLQAWRREPFALQRFLEGWHFSVTQTYELADLLRRWRLCLPQADIWSRVEGLSRSQDVLARLRESLLAAPPRLDPLP